MRHITFIGDSITEGNHLSAYTEAYPYEVLVRVLEPGSTPTYGTFAPWTGAAHTNKATGTNYTIYNAGIGGDTTAMMVTRFPTDVLGHALDHLVVLAGVNDISLGVAPATTQANLAWMAEQAVANGARVTFCLLTPWNNGTTTQKDALDTLNVWITEYAATNGHSVVDTFNALESPDGSRLIPAPWSHDGVHPNEIGEEVMADAFGVSDLTSPYDLDVTLLSQFDLDVILEASNRRRRSMLPVPI